MSKDEYLRKLRLKIKKLPKQEIDEAILYYQEYFEEAGEESTDVVIARLGSPSHVASQILADYAVKDLDTDNSPTKKSFSAVWFIILAILASPIALPLLAVVVLFALSLILVCGMTILTLFIFVIGLPISGFVSTVSGFAVIFQHWQTAIFFIGIGLVVFGIGMLLYSPIVYFSKKVSTGVVRLLKRLVDKITNRRKEGK
ncbi:DUF1700 domain-containing protein [Ornithinibacillus scapharcae]|uniref:DUF1700 domain-containing protein n=1 Tax=Ornithinibacillus scapharcae TaxID=1147159 RepID=UPI000225AAE9|nr:DUF1700 domain-containing protein [Ornithinibacillus scapharcae]